MKKILTFTLALLVSIFGFAQDPISADSLRNLSADSIAIQSDVHSYNVENTTKALGDSAYIKNDFASAIDIYESLLNNGESVEIYYNLGNSYYKTNEIAKSILNYERALLLQPGSSDIHANLAVVRLKTVDKIESTPEIFFLSWTKSLINSMSVDAWANWGIAFFILLIVSAYLFIFSKDITVKKVGFFAGLTFLLFTVFANVFASQQKEHLLNRECAIVMDPTVTVRSTPNDSGTSLFMLHEGAKVSIKDNSMREWKEVRLEDGKVGWLPTSSIEVI